MSPKSSRRPWGSGSITPRPPSTTGEQRWLLVVNTVVDGARVQQSKVVRGNKTVANKALAEFILEREVLADRVTSPAMNDVAGRFFEHLEREGRRPRTIENYRAYWRRRMEPFIGTVKARDLTAAHVDKMLRAGVDAGLKPGSVRMMHAILGSMLHDAYRRGDVEEIVTKRTKAPSVGQREQHPPDAGEVARLVAAAEAFPVPLWPLAVRLALITGARRGELAGLRWSDLDGDRIWIRRSITVTAGGLVHVGPTKTRSNRAVTLDDVTLAELRAAELAARAFITRNRRIWNPDAVILSDDPTLDHGWTLNQISHYWADTRAAAGLPNVRFHDLRHWSATAMLDAGIPLPTVAGRLGHADGITTMSTYAHRTSSGDRVAADELARRLG